MKRFIEAIESFIQRRKGRQIDNKQLLGIVLIATFIGFLLWAALFPLARGIVAPGTIIVDSQRKTIQHLEGGVIKMIAVREGSKVKANDVLIELDDTSAKSEHTMIWSRFMMKLAELDRLRALASGSDHVAFDSLLTINRHQKSVKDLLFIQDNLFRVLRNEHEGRKSIALLRVKQLQQKKAGLMEYLATATQQQSLLEKEVERLKSLHDKRLVESSMVADRMQMLTHQQGEVSNIKSEVWETSLAINEARETALQVEKEWQQELSTLLSETQEAFIEARSKLDAVENVLARTVIKAPIDGTIIGLQFHTIGGVISPGKPIMDIVPDGDEMVIQAKVSPLDIDGVATGMEATVKLSSFRAKTTPQMNGVVESVSPDAFTDQKTGESYYQMRVIIKSDEMKKIRDHDLVPGMPAEVYVDGGSRTLLQYLFDPLVTVFSKGLREE